VRLERLERLMVERLSPSAEPRARPSRRHHYPHVPAPAVTVRGLSVKDGFRTRYFGQNSTKVLLNLVSAHTPIRTLPAQTLTSSDHSSARPRIS
jgi:hypothetical protein